MKSYLITDPSLYGSTPDALEFSLHAVFSRTLPDFVLLRDKQSDDYDALARTFVRVCRVHDVAHVLLHRDYRLAHILGADGVHLTSTQFEAIAEAKTLGLYVIISTHTHDEALRGQNLGADAITYSPIFPSPGKGEPKSLEDLKEIVAKIDIPVFALGGIVTTEQINAVEKCGACGFASIRYFVP